MIALNFKQGTAEWHWNRLGIPTASCFDRIMSTKTHKLLAGAETYMHELLAEWLVGIPNSIEQRGFIERGHDLESHAVAWYEFERNVTTTPVGICLLDNRLAACSPDRLVEEEGGLEIKCPAAKGHVANMLGMGDEYFAQVQGNLWITGRKWWDLVSFHPTIPSVIVRIERDEEYMDALDVAMREFFNRLHVARGKIIERGGVPATELDPAFAATLTPAPPTETATDEPMLDNAALDRQIAAEEAARDAALNL